MRRPDRQRTDWLVLLLLAGLAAAVLLPSALRAGFLNFDDQLFFGVGGEAFRSGGALPIIDPTATIANAYLPVSHLSLYLDVVVHGGSALGAHLHSLVLHVLSAYLLARLLARLGTGRAAAAAAAALFLVHPALVESALWVSGRKDVLSGLFTFWCLDLVVRHARAELPPGRGLAAIGATALAAVYSKGTALVLPALAVIVFALVPRDERRRRPWGALAVTGLIALGAGVHHAVLAIGEGTMVAANPADRVAQVPGAFAHYLGTALWPTGLDVIYPEVATLEAFRAGAVAGLLSLAALAAAAWFAFRRRPLVAGGLALFCVALAPFNTAFPASSIAAADRYLYLAIPGLALAVAGLGRRAGPWLAAAATVPLAVLASARAVDFESSKSLWGASLARDPANAVALYNLADVLAGESPPKLEEAERLLERAVEVARYPQHAIRAETRLSVLAEIDARFAQAARHAVRAADLVAGLASPRRDLEVDLRLRASRLARRGGEVALAKQQIELARSVEPDHPLVLCFDAALLQAEAMDAHGKVDPDDPRRAEAEALLERAAAADPDLYELHLIRAEWAAAVGQVFLAAEKHYRRAIEIQPLRSAAHLGRAALLNAEGMHEAAEKAVRAALSLGVDDPGLHFQLAVALAGRGRLDDARKFYEAFLRVRPRDRAAKFALASVLAALTMRELHQLAPDVIERRAERIEELDTSNAKARVMRAVVARSRGDMQEALVLLELAREAMPGDEEVLRMFAETLRDRGWQLQLEGRKDLAMEHFRRFLDVAPADMPTEAALNAVRQEWKRRRDEGQVHLLADEVVAAEACLRRCLELLPEETSPNLQLGMALLLRGREHWEEALECFARAAEGRRRAGGDDSLAVLYEVTTLRRLGRDDDAIALGERYLDAPSDEASAEILERIRSAMQR